MAGLAAKTRLFIEKNFLFIPNNFSALRLEDKLLVGLIKMVGMCLD